MISETVSVETKFRKLLLEKIREQEQVILRGHILQENYTREKNYLRGLDDALEMLNDAARALRDPDQKDL
ncbi:hypothetical protein [Chelatococcus sp.]|uniref:hypothetical protein n=1 Tax=Chelatococcus sp. TaxID=1953771 RepID=UPI001EBEECEC|nr:hypothetical protein [Chelatococcus sp.]MBX3547316.1 hypothetical protein [Chelatococcus sp.]CAH1677918.1 hypothetical protein CHELA41_24462 [Hyphomicrobiales bacterium]